MSIMPKKEGAAKQNSGLGVDRPTQLRSFKVKSSLRPPPSTLLGRQFIQPTTVTMAAVTRGFSSASSRVTSIPVFLAPAFSRPCSFPAAPSSRSFSSSEPRGKRQSKAGETNKKRGVSAMRGTGPLVNRGLWSYPLPEPVARTRVPKQTDYEDTADHGLWGFFHKDRKALLPPEDESSHGMPAL